MLVNVNVNCLHVELIATTTQKKYEKLMSVFNQCNYQKTAKTKRVNVNVESTSLCIDAKEEINILIIFHV